MRAVELEIGTVVRDVWKVTGKLGEGGCGVVYEVISLKTKRRAALKVEPTGLDKEDEILKMEVFVLRKLQTSSHACRLLMYGKLNNFNFVVMTLLGRSLSDIRRQFPEQRLTTGSSVRLGLQCLEAIKHLHDVGFVHRDVKPSNFALGLDELSRSVFILDFGLARQYAFFEPIDGAVQKIWREPRREVVFRGTVRYCSMNVHRRLEQGPCDDLWSLFYQLIEMIRGSLPWRSMDRHETQDCKERVEDRVLLSSCPREFTQILHYLRRLNYRSEIDYEFMGKQLLAVMARKNWPMDESFDWEKGGRCATSHAKAGPLEPDNKTDELRRHELEQGDQQTYELVDSEVNSDTEASDLSGISVDDDTLERLDEINNRLDDLLL